jgi:bilirubin oxidase
VNGGRVPVLTVRPGATQRWRILNATSAQFLRLALDGHLLTLVGTDGGLLGAPVAGLAEVLVAPAQRVELIVTASTSRGARFTLRALRYAPDSMGFGTYMDQDLLTLATTTEAVAGAVAIPASLRAVAELGPAVAQKRVLLTETGMGMAGGSMMGGSMMGFLINGRSFDMNRVDLVSTAGECELWTIVNDTSMEHPIHIHGTRFQLVSRESRGIMAPAPYAAWIDTVSVPAGQSATVKVRQDLAGKRMFHCHILEHEDAGMMAVLDVRPR